MKPATMQLIGQLREEWRKIETIDPCGPAYAKLCKLLDAMSQSDLRILERSNIKFVSSLARNRIKRS